MLAELSEKEMDERFALLSREHPAKGPYHIFKQAGEKVRGGVIVGLGARLQVFQNKMIRNITAYPEIDLLHFYQGNIQRKVLIISLSRQVKKSEAVSSLVLVPDCRCSRTK